MTYEQYCVEARAAGFLPVAEATWNNIVEFGRPFPRPKRLTLERVEQRLDEAEIEREHREGWS